MDKKSKNTLIVSIIALALVLVGVTYAYFSARITGLESASTLSLTAGRMGIVYSEGDENISVNNIYPREEAWLTKTITLTGYNTTDQVMSYDLSLNVITNTFPNNYLTYDLTLLSGSNGTPIATRTNKTINGTGPIRFGRGVFVNADGDQHEYQLKIYFKDNGEDQNDAQEAVFNAKISIGESLNRDITIVPTVQRLVSFDIDQEACEEYFEGLSAEEISTVCSGGIIENENFPNGTFQIGDGNEDDYLISDGVIINPEYETVTLQQVPEGYCHQEGSYTYCYKAYPSLVQTDDSMFEPMMANHSNWDHWSVRIADYQSTAPLNDIILGSINGKSVIPMGNVFESSNASYINLNNFDTSFTTSMDHMFSYSRATSLDLTSFNTSNVTTMSGMFQNSEVTNLDLSSFDTSNVTDMSYMFSGIQATTLDLSNFDTSNVTNMQGMFAFSNITILDLSSFDFSKVTYAHRMFSNSSIRRVNVGSTTAANQLCSLSDTSGIDLDVYVGDTLSCTIRGYYA